LGICENSAKRTIIHEIIERSIKGLRRCALTLAARGEKEEETDAVKLSGKTCYLASSLIIADVYHIDATSKSSCVMP
jgi:hypothetical protein